MDFRFSPTTGGFYLTGINASIPADAVTVSAADHRALLEAQANGATIVAGAGGKPKAQYPASPTVAQRRAAAIVATKREAERRILGIAPLWRQSNDAAAIAKLAFELAVGGDGVATEADAAFDRRDRIDAIRDSSNLLEAAIATMNTTALDQLDVAAATHWPAGEAA